MADLQRLRMLTRLVRTRSSRPVVAAMRQVIESWGTLTSSWRVMPSFIVVGAQRSGTTTLYRVLSSHPSVVRPTASKGTGYFDAHYHHGARWYRGHFPLRWSARRRGGETAVTFESSGYYLFHPLAAARIARDLPDVRIVVMVREPVERAYSAHRHELARGFETEPFEAALSLEDERLRGEVELIEADPTYDSFHHRHHAYLARSRYSEQIDRFVDLVGRDRVYIVDADAFFSEPGAEFDRLREWLGLPPWQPSAVEQWNARPRLPLSPEMRAWLDEYFEDSDRRLGDLMGRAPSWRPNQSPS